MNIIAAHAHKIFLVDDDLLFCRATKRRLYLLGFDTVILHDVKQLFDRLKTDNPDIVLLDLELGREDGHAVCRKLRTVSAVPIIMLTGNDSREMIVSCLEAGADDYVVKPFDVDELSARIRAVLRRHSTDPGSDAAAKSERLTYATLTLDILTATLRGEKSSCQLSDTEAALLSTLIGGAPGSVDRELLCRMALRRSWNAGDRTIDVLIGRLRKKINDASPAMNIVAVRGSGYALRASSAAASAS